MVQPMDALICKAKNYVCMWYVCMPLRDVPGTEESIQNDLLQTFIHAHALRIN